MKKALTLVVAVAMGLSSAVFVAETAVIPIPIVTTIEAAPTRTTHRKKQHKAAPAQKAQAAKKHHKNAKAEQKASEQKVQATKKHIKKHDHQQPTKPIAQLAA